MRGLMQDSPLLISSLIEHAARFHGDSRIVSRTVEGAIHRYGYADSNRRAKRLARALLALGLETGERVGTLAWNGYRHFEIYFAAPGAGAVCHTVNPRLFPEQIVYIVNHAGDRYLFLDLTFVPLAEELQERFETVERYVVMTDEEHMPRTSLEGAICYETLIGRESDDYEWPALDEGTAACLCYTSGTTGEPRGVLYSHRSTVLHSFMICSSEGLGLSSHDTVMPAVSMFHANAWGIPHAAAMCGAELVLPGARLDGASLHQLIESEGVTVTAAVPTVWLGLLEYLRENGKTLTGLRQLLVGGSAAPLSMIEAFERDYGVPVFHAWGMTEMNPVGTTGVLKKRHMELPDGEQAKKKTSQGRAVYGVELKIVDADGNELPRDGETSGHLMVRGPWIISRYFKDEAGEVLDPQGWFDTGDVATLDRDGYIRITDRAKDLIKSGGEWISSIQLENLVLVLKEGQKLSKEEILDRMRGKVAKWQLPDDVLFLDELPHTATGKVSKAALRGRFADYVLPDVKAAQ